VAINRDTWDSLPEEVQNAMIEAGKYYTESHGQDLVDRHEFALNKMVELGASQDPPVQIIPMPAEERAKWVNALPDLPADWAAPLEEQGIPAKEFMAAYMNGLRERGEQPVRDWDK
jgi:TRAP-type C4-dicarboxylate transport system substrate-binding protein